MSFSLALGYMMTISWACLYTRKSTTWGQTWARWYRNIMSLASDV